MFYTKKHFSQPVQWYRWEERSQIRGKDRIGVYVLAFLTTENPKPISIEKLLCKEVVYIGETHGRTKNLAKRWTEFESVATTGEGNHSGGKTFHKLDMRLQGLFVAALPVPEHMNALDGQLLTMLMERELLWEFGQRFRRRPECNKK